MNLTTTNVLTTIKNGILPVRYHARMVIHAKWVPLWIPTYRSTQLRNLLYVRNSELMLISAAQMDSHPNSISMLWNSLHWVMFPVRCRNGSTGTGLIPLHTLILLPRNTTSMWWVVSQQNVSHGSKQRLHAMMCLITWTSCRKWMPARKIRKVTVLPPTVR